MPTSTARSTQFLLERFSPKQVRSIAAANRRICLWEGAVSSGKTIASLWAWLMFVESASTSGELVMIGKTRDAVYRNALQPLMNPEIFEDLALQVDYNPGAPTARIFGRLVHVIGANDVKSENKIRGMTCVGAYVDEATLLPETFWDMLRTRMRAPGARILATTNPDAPTHWLREKFIDDPEVRRSMKVFSFELDDNIHLTPEYVEETKQMYRGLFYRRFILGEWCAAEGAVFDMFDRARHVVDILPPITRWLALGIDYGTSNPTHAVLLAIGNDGCLYAAADWRYDGRKAQRQITDVEASERLRAWLSTVSPPGTRERGVQPEVVAVDPSAASFHVQLRADGLSPRPAHNKVLSGIRILMALFAADRLRIHSSCTELLKEIDGYVWDPKATERGEDAPLKQNDHACLVAGTAVLTAHGERPIETVQAGDLVLTRQGWKPVEAAGMTAHQADVYEVELSNGRTLIGTGNHPVWVAGLGWERIDALRYGDILESWQNALTQSSSTASSSADIQMLLGSPTAGITSPGSPTVSRASGDSTRRSGRPHTGATYPRATTFITPTETTSTTTRATSSASAQTNTGSTTQRKGAVWSGSTNSNISTPSGLSPQSGMAPRKAEPGIASMEPARGKGARNSLVPASSAARVTELSPLTAMSGSVPTSASPLGGGPQDSTTSRVPASSAARYGPSTGTAAPGSAAVRVLRVTAGTARRAVWNLTVADCPEYFAQGVAVHNCDALRYAVKTTQHIWRPQINIPLPQADRENERAA